MRNPMSQCKTHPRETRALGYLQTSYLQSLAEGGCVGEMLIFQHSKKEKVLKQRNTDIGPHALKR